MPSNRRVEFESANLECLHADGARRASLDSKTTSTTVDTSIHSNVKVEEDSVEDDVCRFYPKDCYSFIALCYPKKKEWPSFVFLTGLVVFSFQMTFLVLLIMSVTSEKLGTIGEIDNPGKSLGATFFPANSKQIVRATQVFSMITSFLFPYSSLKDVVKAVLLFPRSSKSHKKSRVRLLRVACMLRFLQGVVAIFASWLLVMTSDNVVDIILNFTAINFISNLDEIAYSMAASGELGLNFKKQLKKVEKTELPPGIFESRIICHWCVVTLMSLLFFVVMMVVMVAQERNDIWSTKELRVRFHDDTGIEAYSGCFKKDSSGYSSKRHIYHRYIENGTTSTTATIGYCEETRHWVLLKGHHTNPCIKGREVQLAYSAKMDTFDIQASYEESWVSSSGTPLEFYFFPDGPGDTCSSFIGDGTCDPVFNMLDYDYDDGDCCASTCIGTNCGRGENYSFFGSTDVVGTGFPSCIDKTMVTVTILLNDIRSSRDPMFAKFNKAFGHNIFMDEDTWRAVKPARALFALECDGKNVLSIFIDKSMENKTETVMVNEGAACSLVIRNTTTNGFKPDHLRDDPIWYVDYTIFHNRSNNIMSSNENELLEILSARSKEAGSVKFTRISDCFIETLKDHIDIRTIYTGSDPSNKAFHWLLDQNDNSEYPQFKDEFFIERYALATLDFTLSSQTSFINEQRQCTWPNIMCTNGTVTQVELKRKNLEEFSAEMVNTIQILSHLTELNLDNNRITSIPSAMTSLSNLASLSFYSNEIRAIPSGLTSMTKLTSLDLGYNLIEQIPSEFGLIPSLEMLDLRHNAIRSIPAEISSTTSLVTLHLGENDISQIPEEITSMTTLKHLNLGYNNISQIPKQIRFMTNLTHLSLCKNNIRSVPSEIRSLTRMEYLNFENNRISNITSEIGLMTRLKDLALRNNGMKSIPHEIGSMASLRSLDIAHNFFEAIPSSLYNVSSLKELNLRGNKITTFPSEMSSMHSIEKLNLSRNSIQSIPTEIRSMTSLVDLNLGNNEITSIPSEIGLMTSLTRLALKGNDFDFRDLPIEIQDLCESITNLCDIN